VTSEAFWPGDKPAPQQAGKAEEAVVVEDETDAEHEPSFAANGSEPVAEAQPAVEEGEPGEADTGEQEAVAEPEHEPEHEHEHEHEPELHLAGHAPGELDLPHGVAVVEGVASGVGRSVGIVVSRFNGDVTNRLLESALAALDDAEVPRSQVTIVPVPGAFELPLAAMGLAKSRRYACVLALGCVIRGETAHFDYVAGEAASGLQLAALETGIPVAFGVLTVDTLEQALARADKGAEAARSALEMADLFSQLRAQRA
jgi:6,7-dimethyl-8-ribityllumazine synthase